MQKYEKKFHFPNNYQLSIIHYQLEMFNLLKSNVLHDFRKIAKKIFQHLIGDKEKSVFLRAF